LKSESFNILTQTEKIADIDLNLIDSAYKFALMIPQSETERVLEEHLATFGLAAERQKELKSFEETANGVSCNLQHTDGSEETVNASWLIGCDGAHSIVRHQLGKQFLGSTMLNDWLLADVHLAGISGPPAGNIFWHDQGILVILPLGGTRYRVIADLGESSGPIGEANRPSPTLADVQQVLDVRGPAGVIASDAVWLSSFTINERKVEDYRSGRIFLAGDAAHVHSPAGGQGMNTGMQDAFNLAWKLALVFHGSSNPELLLDSYSAERSAIAKLVLEASGRVTSMALLRGGIKQAIRNHVASLLFGLAPVKHTMADVLTEVAIGYHHSPLNGDATAAPGGPMPGKRAPIRQEEVPVGSGRLPRFALYADPRNMPPSLLEKFSSIVEPVLRAPFHSGGIWLVRPDGYVALSATTDSWDAVTAYLSHLFGDDPSANRASLTLELTT
jgi:2-polyprenyl-6-methoxyphenol hydroxylase-like FAD-dependent oxidoreductase